MSYNPAPIGPAGGQPPASNLVFAILTTVLCCLPAGVVSIVYAAQVNSKWAQGDATGAQESSRKARQWAIISAIVGVVVIVLYIIAVVAGGASLGSFAGS